MKKPANTNFPLQTHIRDRWSPVSYSDREVSKEQLGSLLEAARWAPSCYNEQPWHFLVGFKGSDSHDRLCSCLVPGNAVWACKAPLLILSVARTFFERNDTTNSYAQHDVGLAVSQMLIQATSMGLVTHQMAGYDKAKARDIFELPRRYEPVAMIAIGYLGTPASLTDELKARELGERTRKPLASICAQGRWGSSVDFASK